MKPLETTVEEVLRNAIQSEVQTRVFYQTLAERTADPSVRKRMLQLADGELGFYVVSDGTKNPYRVRCRPPCFAIYQAFGRMIIGQTIPDVVAALGSLNIIAGELDH